ncbi:MAG: hypothetical protein ACR5K5_06615 [Wolbachia sp.]
MINAIDCSRVKMGWFTSRKRIHHTRLALCRDISVVVGKSLLAQQLMTATATGKPWLNMDVKQVKTYGVFCTDEKERKQCAINELYPDLINNIRLLSRAGEAHSFQR